MVGNNAAVKLGNPCPIQTGVYLSKKLGAIHQIIVHSKDFPKDLTRLANQLLPIFTIFIMQAADGGILHDQLLLS